jgi:hypothetical protein
MNPDALDANERESNWDGQAELISCMPARLSMSAGKPASARWLSRPCLCAAWTGLSLAFVTPPHGTGLTVCWLKSATGIPCPGCGLTRSLSCGLRGMFTESWHYHPMGLLILALFFTLAGASILKRFRAWLVIMINSNEKLFKFLYLGFVFAFVGFGFLRAMVTFVDTLP